MPRLASVAAVALGLALVACLPVASAHGPDPQAVYKFSEPGEVHGWSNATLDAVPSQQLRDEFDRDGDDEIAGSEAEAMEAFLKDRAESGEARTAWDGQPPTDSEVLDVTITNAVGPVDAEEPLHLHSRSTMSYEAGQAPETPTWIRSTESADEDRHLKIQPPRGYEVASHDGLDEVETEGTWVTGQTSSEDDVVLVFADGQASLQETPGPSLLLLALAGLAATGLARRR